MLPVVVLSLLLVTYNAALNLVPFPRWSYVPLNLVLTVALLVYARRRGLGWDALGLDPSALAAGLRWGTLAVAVVAVAVGVGVGLGDRVPTIGRLLADERAAGIGSAGLAYEVLLRIPFGTALFEEVAFRGVLLGLVAERYGMVAGVVVSSLVFGLWHIGPGIATLRLNAPDMSVVRLAAGVSVMVVVTAVAGAAFCWLRIRSGSLLAPILAHWATNGFGLGGAVVSRRSG